MNPKQILTIALIVATGIYFAINSNSDQVRITGKITNPKGESVTFSNQDTSYSTTANANGHFTISFNLDSATYLNFGHGVEATAMHVNPGDKIKLIIDTDQFDETIQYTGSEESNFLAWKYLYIEGGKNSQEVINKSDLVINYSITNNFTSVETLSLYLDSLYKNIYTELSDLNKSDFYHTEYQNCQNNKNTLLEKHKNLLSIPKSGEAAIDFTYPDKHGNEFSLTSFKGNLVYVDVWATWCGPCKYQIPFLSQLEKDYHKKNITFLSVSVDNDKDAWKKMIEEKELGGVQLWANGWSEITKSYAINGIPRFMLFDAKGNVISTKAPKPSSEEIRRLLDANL